MKSRIFFKLLRFALGIFVIAAVAFYIALNGTKPLTTVTNTRLILGTFLAAAATLLFAGFGARSISRRLQAIVAFAGRAAAGDLSARIDEHVNDEIGDVAAALDKTARKLENSFQALETSRQQLETLLNSMQEAVIAVSADGRTLWANERMSRLSLSGLRLGQPLVETVRDPDFLRAVDDACHTRTVQTARVSSSAPARSFNITAAPMPGGGAVAVLHDLTDIERVEKTRRDFIANVSHELRTPLTSIQGYTETLLDSPSDPDTTKEFLEIIRKSAFRMARLTEDLLVLARVESGEETFRFRPVPAELLLLDACQSFVDAAKAREVEICTAPDSEAWLSTEVTADPDAVHQIFSNLIDNALKYGSGGKRLMLGCRPGTNNVLEFYVRDFGPGIASEHLPRLFERFYRVDKARSRESGGTGLGLAIVKHIVRVHGGTVRAESELGRGSEFVFTLPMAVSPMGTN